MKVKREDPRRKRRGRKHTEMMTEEEDIVKESHIRNGEAGRIHTKIHK